MDLVCRSDHTIHCISQDSEYGTRHPVVTVLSSDSQLPLIGPNADFFDAEHLVHMGSGMIYQPVAGNPADLLFYLSSILRM